MSPPGNSGAGRRFRYEWRRTLPDSRHDFAAWDGKVNVGRVYREDRNRKSGQWFWSMTASVAGRAGVACEGYLPTKEEAVKKVENVYAALKARAAAEAEWNEGVVDSYHVE